MRLVFNRILTPRVTTLMNTKLFHIRNISRISFNLFFVGSTVFASALFSGCGSESNTPKPERPLRLARVSSEPNYAEASRPVRKPWEIWGFGRALTGQRLINSSLLLGDEYLKNGFYLKGLEEYQKAQSPSLTEIEREALTLRIATTNLVLDRPDQTLSTLSDYFRSKQVGVDAVPSSMAICFGFAYGRKGDVAQSLAWFSRSASSAAPADGMKEIAEIGVRSLFAGLAQDRFEQIATAWEPDAFIRPLAGAERARRAQPATASLVVQVKFFPEFFPASEATSTVPVNNQGTVTTVAAGSIPIGVLLPLTGQYANLGASLKNGIDMAIEGQSQASENGAPGASPFTVLVKDSGADSAQALASVRELTATGGTDVVLGPLLADASRAVAELAKQQRFNLVAFSKRSDFELGQGIYRLGPTVESQIESLLDTVERSKGFRRFAGIFSDDASGHEFADVFRAKLGERKLQLAYESFYKKDEINGFLSIAQSMEGSDVQAIFFPEGIANAARLFTNFAPQFRKRVVPLGSANWDNALELSQSGVTLDGAIFVSPFFASSKRPLITQFNETYKAKFGVAPDFLAAQGFDAATLVASALRRVKNEQLTFAAALQSSETYEGLTGKISINANGELRRKFSLVEVHDGKAEEIDESVVAPVEPSVPAFVMRGNARLEGTALLSPPPEKGDTVR